MIVIPWDQRSRDASVDIPWRLLSAAARTCPFVEPASADNCWDPYDRSTAAVLSATNIQGKTWVAISCQLTTYHNEKLQNALRINQRLIETLSKQIVMRTCSTQCATLTLTINITPLRQSLISWAENWHNAYSCLKYVHTFFVFFYRHFSFYFKRPCGTDGRTDEQDP